MGYELVYNPRNGTWSIYSTVTMEFVAEGLRSPMEVAMTIVGSEQYEFHEIPGEGRVPAKVYGHPGDYAAKKHVIQIWVKEARRVKHANVNAIETYAFTEGGGIDTSNPTFHFPRD